MKGEPLKTPIIPSTHDLLQNVKRVGDQHGSSGRTGNDDQLRRLKKYLDVAMLHQISAEHGPEDDHNSDDGKHLRSGEQICS